MSNFYAELGYSYSVAFRITGAVFLIERTSYTKGHQPIDYEKLHYRGDLIRFVTRVARRPSERS